MEASAGLKPLITRRFTTLGWSLDDAEWGRRDVWVGTKHEHLGVEAPVSWSDNAVGITSKLYLSKSEHTREDSIKDLIKRIAAKIAVEAHDHGYFGIPTSLFLGHDFDDARAVPAVAMWTWLEQLDNDAGPRVLYDELCYIMVNQFAVFNSPVLFNVGRPDRPQQVSACFILSVEDTTDSIMSTARREAFIFKGGSGSGFDVSRLRGSMEPLSSGGIASGPVSFMRLWDAGAGTFKSGGMTRRAAKLVKMDADHPDIRDFITCKVREEDRLRRAAEAGEDIGFSEEGERNVAEMTSFQNANNSVGVTDEFMEKATNSIRDLEMPASDWPLIARKTGKVVALDGTAELLDLIASSAHACACPGMMFMDKINLMHTTPTLDGEHSPIRSSNPCGEYLSNDDTSCNLGSVNILKFVGSPIPGDGPFAVEDFRHVVDVMALSMDVLVSLADFPDPIIAERSRELRQLGLGYSNMGAAIMAQGLPYDSDEGRDFAASVTALLTGRVYRKSAQIAQKLEPFHYWEENREAMLAVINRHHLAIPDDQRDAGGIWDAADFDWREAISLGIEHGYRNAQATVIPPAGTTSYFLDCDTTGIEPAWALVTHKQLAGGGDMVIENQSVQRGLSALGYVTGTVDELWDTLDDREKSVFHGAGEISAEGHIKMMAAVQPFVSGAISKTINMPSSATVQDVRDAYELAWRLGLKDIAIYRDGSKARQVLSTKPKPKAEVDEEGTLQGVDSSNVLSWPQALQAISAHPQRQKLPRTRRSVTHKIHLRGATGEYEGYIHLSSYPDGKLGEMFVDGFGRNGSFVLNALACWAQDFSIAVQHGVPWEKLMRKKLGVSDETGGMVVPDPDANGPMPIRSARSIFDYIARYVVFEFGDDDLRQEFGLHHAPTPISPTTVAAAPMSVAASNGHIDLPTQTCNQCGGVMRPTGGCYTCQSCFSTTGCG